MAYIVDFLKKALYFCYEISQNYGTAIILFTLLSKLVLLPVSVWVQLNSIKMVKIQPELNEVKITYYGDRDTIADKQAEVMKREGYNAFATILPMFIQIVLLLAMIAAIKAGMKKENLNLRFVGLMLDIVPVSARGISYLVPLGAGFSAYILCKIQNVNNVLQENSSKAMQDITMVFSVGLSLYLGFFVQAGVAIYWIFSNLFSIIQILLLNWIINPKNYIDYNRLEKSQQKLKALENISAQKQISKLDKKREKADYKKFFSVENKKLVFYSEGSGFYKYFQGIIEYLLQNTNLVIHYITSDPEDSIFELARINSQIHPYYIGENKLITLMMKMDADLVVMTMPDLENFHIKRSYVKKDIEYIFVPHALHSINLMMRTGCIDHFDTVLISGKHQKEEIRRTEEVYKLPQKKLVECGYPLLDSMIKEYRDNLRPHKDKIVLIAPSWQDEGIMDLCLEDMLNNLEKSSYKVIVRPHPQYVRHKPEHLDALTTKYVLNDNIEIQTDFSSNSTVFEADVLITDWSGIAYEYAFTTQRPVLFINTPMKVQNAEYERIAVVPMNIWMRSEIGRILKPDETDKVTVTIDKLIEEQNKYKDVILNYRNEYIYNLGQSSEIGAKYIINSIQEKIFKRKAETKG